MDYGEHQEIAQGLIWELRKTPHSSIREVSGSFVLCPTLRMICSLPENHRKVFHDWNSGKDNVPKTMGELASDIEDMTAIGQAIVASAVVFVGACEKHRQKSMKAILRGEKLT